MSSPTDLPSVPAIQTPQSQTNGHDSTDHPQPPHDAETQPPPQDDAVSGDKRKRDVEEEEGGDNKTKQHPLWKTSLCSFFRRQDASCGHGAGCRYAHSEAELRPRPDNTWDPTSERAKKASCEEEKECAAIDDVMMTEALEDDDEDGEGDGFGSDPALSKCLVHLPRNWKSDKLKEFLSEQGIQYKSAKKKKGMALGFMSFESAEQLETAVKALDGISIGNNNIKVADVLPRSFEKKTKSALGLPLIGESGEDSMVANGVEDGDGMKGRSARTVVTPLAHMPYADQLEQKKSSVTQILKKLTRNARKACPNGVPLPEWILKSREIGGLPCILEGILASPVVNGYRNKCEFSVGHSLQGKVTVGFMLGNFREGVTAVEEPLDCPNVSAISCKFASIFQEFLQQSSLPVWNRFKNNGFWRQLTVREGRSGSVSDAENCELNISEILLMVQVSTAGLDNSLVTSEFERLAQAFSAGATENSPSLPLTALVIQDHQGISNVAPADAPLHSLCISKAKNGSEIQATNNMTEPKIHDYISDLRFCISPTAFFQVNTLAAEKLYSLAGDWAELGPDTLLFDVCCGTGTIGLTLAHRVGMVVGIEMNASAVLDAQRNAEINGIKNCRFVCSKAEDVMRSLLEEYLTVPEKQVTNAIEGSDKAIVTDEKKIVATDEEISIIKDEKPNPEESSSHEPENGKTASDSIENGMHELQQSCSSEKCFKNIVAIVDPPRSGLHPTVIKALRTHSGLRRLVYISCNPETLVANAIELCTPSPDKIEKNKNNRAWRNMSSAGLARHRAKSMPASEPFRPVKAMAVDLFPHTVHCELVMLLERIHHRLGYLSYDQRFVLGLFSPPNSTAWYLGLGYEKFPDVVVWVANRENPLPDSNGALKLSEKGSLILSDEMNNTVWSSNSSRVAENPVAQLLVTGNLVVIDQALITTAAADSISYVYQSFDYPSDTLLPDMKVGWDFRTGQNRFLTSWKDASDPSLGEYTYRIDNPELPQLVVAQGSKKVFRTGPWNGLRFSGTPGSVVQTKPFLIRTFVYNTNEMYYTYEVIDDSILTRVTMTESGLAQRLVVNEGSSEWAVLYTLQNNQCDVYGECGANGICKIYNSPICECLQGFVPISPKEWEFSNWTSGCTRRTKLHCEKGEGFVKINNVKLPDLLDFRVNKNLLRSGDCEAECLRNCSCVAYANSNITSRNKTCLMWFGKLIDMREIVELDGDQIYIRMPASELGDTSQKHKRIVLISVISSAGFMLLFLGLSCWYIYLKKREKERGSRTSEEDLELPLFDYGTIATATNDFSGTNKLGEGGFGPVYKAKLTQEEFVAVKRLSRDSGQGLEEFKNEVTMIANLQHWNLVKLLGCCIEGEERMLIYEYMPNKSLDCFIFDENKKLLLKWQKRRDIIIGIGRGLLYLHEDSRLRIIHRDLKSSNILLDDELNPKISDFGIARIFRLNQTEAKTKRVIGTYGYMSPEYAIDGNFSVKSDVFSFGVLLLEIVSGKKNRGFHHPDHHHNLLGHVWLLWKQNKGLELMDICLEDSYVEFELLRCIQVGLLCVQKLPKDRPVMSSMVLMLSNEGATLPQPKEPGFFIERGSIDFDSSRGQGNSNTGNTITITTVEPR